MLIQENYNKSYNIASKSISIGKPSATDENSPSACIMFIRILFLKLNFLTSQAQSIPTSSC